MRPALWTVSLSIIFAPSISGALEPADDVRTALSEMHRWVGQSEKGAAWKRFLRSQDLAGELARGEAADRAVVGEILNIYSGDTPGLDRQQFVAVRESIRNWADQLPHSIAELPDFAASFRDQFVEISDAEVESRRTRLDTAVNALDRFLLSGSQQNADKWKQYLRWDDLTAQVRSTPNPDLSVLQRVLSTLKAHHDGLELAQFTDVRDSLRAYMSAIFFRSQPNARQLFGQRIEELSRLLGKGAALSAAETENVGRIVGWLESGNQTPQLVEGVRRHYWQPNLHAEVSERFLTAGIERSVDEVQNVNEVILGTSIHGVARMQGQVGIRLVPAEEQAVIDLELIGAAAGSNVGYNGPVTICSYGVTQIYSRKRIYLDEVGLVAESAVANCSTSSTINGIAARSKLVRRIAWRRAGQMKSQSEAIAAGRAEGRVAQRFDSQAREMLATANDQYRSQLRNPLVRQNAFPRTIRFQTDDDYLQVKVLQAGAYQVAAAMQPPPREDGHDISLRLHESFVANFSESLIGGQTLTDRRLVDLLTEVGAEIPEELDLGDDKDPWSITFASARPVSASFSDGMVRIAIRGRRFTRGDQVTQYPIEISARYVIEKEGDGARIARQGDVEVEFLTQSSLSVAQVAMKAFMRTKFEALFKQEMIAEGLELPGDWQRAGTMLLHQLDAGANWLTVGWKMQDEADTLHTANSSSHISR